MKRGDFPPIRPEPFSPRPGDRIAIIPADGSRDTEIRVELEPSPIPWRLPAIAAAIAFLAGLASGLFFSELLTGAYRIP